MTHPDSPLIDGAVPHTPQERCSILLDYGQMLMDKAWRDNTWDTFPSGTYVKLDKLNEEYRHHYRQEKDHDFPWYELEDDIIDLINDLLPEDVVMLLHPDDPGTVVIWERSEDGDDYP